MAGRRVLICDDQKRFIDAFKKVHESFYTIDTETDIRKLLERIENSKPDLVLLDIYHPKDDKSDYNTRLASAEKQLNLLDTQIETTKQIINKTWDPLGIRTLRLIREKYEDLPVIIFSQTGPVLLDDDQIESVIKNDGFFLLKKEHNMRNMYEVLNSIMDNKSAKQKLRDEIKKLKHQIEKQKQIQNKFKVSFILSWIVFSIIILIVVSINFKIDVLQSVLIGVISSLLATLIGWAISKRIEKV